MPLVKTAYPKEQPVSGMYMFSEKNKEGWKNFWKEMNGDKDKIIKWAADAKIEMPEEWYLNLHLFLFDCYSGELLTKKAAAKSFNNFLKKAMENHINNPKDKRWYLSKGMTKRQFINMLQNAAEMEKPNSIIAYMNGKNPGLGYELYDEFILSLTGWKWETKKKASELAKKAYEIESNTYYDSFRKDDIIIHMAHPQEPMKVEAVIDDGIVAVKENGSYAYLIEPWNLRKV